MTDGIPEGIEVFVNMRGHRLTIDQAVARYRCELLRHARHQARLLLRMERRGRESIGVSSGSLVYEVGVRRLDPITRLGALARTEVEPIQQKESS